MAKYVVTLSTEVEVDADSHSEAHEKAEEVTVRPNIFLPLKATYSKKVSDG